MAETVVVADYSLLALPAQLDVKDGCLIESGSIAWPGSHQMLAIAGRGRRHGRGPGGR
jgi:hypothetical protein